MIDGDRKLIVLFFGVVWPSFGLFEVVLNKFGMGVVWGLGC